MAVLDWIDVLVSLSTKLSTLCMCQ